MLPLFSSFTLFALALTPGRVSAEASMRVATYNLRYDSQPDDVSVQASLDSLPDPLEQYAFYAKKGEQPWSTRRVKIFQHLQREGVVLASFQEALVRQVNDLAELLGDGWGWVGVGRDDGASAGEFSPIFYKKSDVDLVSNDTFWLSDTPDVPSAFPNATGPRICTATQLVLKSGPGAPVPFTYLNTHLDDRSDGQRRLAASMMLARARYEAHRSGGAPVIVTGDFNSPATGKDSGAYAIITGARAPVAVDAAFAAKYAVPEGELPDFKMVDLKGQVPRQAVSGDFATYTGFEGPGDASVYSRVDFVYGGSNGRWTATSYKVGSSLTDDGVLASDHRPVFVDITLQ